MDHPLKPIIALSACLNGSLVRYDGGHRLEKDLLTLWGPHAEFLPMCPESESGLGIPREPMQLLRRDGTLSAIGKESGKDHSRLIRDWSHTKLQELKKAGIHGLILKSRSPSCAGDHTPNGEYLDGILAEMADKELPLIPRTDEKELRDPLDRANYLSRLFALASWRALKEAPPSLSRLNRYHSANRLRLLSHNPKEANRLGRLAANPHAIPISERITAYEKGLLHCLGTKPTMANHHNIIIHLATVLDKSQNPNANTGLKDEIENLLRKGTPLNELRSLLFRHSKNKKGTFPGDQTYLSLHPMETASP